MPNNQITATGSIAPGPDPTGPSSKEIHQILFDTLNKDGYSLKNWSCAHQPYHGILYTGATNDIDLYIYAWRIIPGYRKSPSEKRIEIRNNVNRNGFIRPITATEKTVLLGIYDSPHGTPIFAAWAADDPLNFHPHQRSVYVDVEDLQAAITEGIHSCFNRNKDKIFTFLPEYLGTYIDLVTASNKLPSGTPSSSLATTVKRATTSHKKVRTIRSVDDILASMSKITDTEKDAVTKQRVGQGYFKELLLNKYSCKCALCSISTKSMLVASHIKEWSVASNTEKLDENNGLLLCAHHDALFDKHLISFDSSGDVIVSPTLSASEQTQLGIPSIPKITMTPAMDVYMAYHRAHLKK
jgi:hypothetical protein